MWSIFILTFFCSLFGSCLTSFGPLMTLHLGLSAPSLNSRAPSPGLDRLTSRTVTTKAFCSTLPMFGSSNTYYSISKSRVNGERAREPSTRTRTRKIITSVWVIKWLYPVTHEGHLKFSWKEDRMWNRKWVRRSKEGTMIGKNERTTPGTPIKPSARSVGNEHSWIVRNIIWP